MNTASKPAQQTRVSLDMSVIIDYAFSPNNEVMNTRHYLLVDELPGARSALATLIFALGPENVFLLTLANEEMQERINHWHAFHRGVIPPQENIRFFSTYEEKAKCITDERITFVVERNLHIFGTEVFRDLSHFERCLFQDDGEQTQKYPRLSRRVRLFQTWEGLISAIMEHSIE